jgi:hypothetical protein
MARFRALGRKTTYVKWRIEDPRSVAVCSRFWWTTLFSPTLAPCDFWPSKDGLSGYRFASVQVFPWGWGSALQSGRSRVRFPMELLEFFTDNPSGRTVALGSIQPSTEMRTRGFCWREWRPLRGADNLIIFTCRSSWHLPASAPWSRNGLSRPVMAYLYLSIESGSYCYTTRGPPEVLAAMAGLLECVQNSRISRVTVLGFIQSIFLSLERVLQHGRYNQSV